METLKTYENFPLPLVAASVLLNIAIIAVGASILSGFGNIMTIAYVLFCIGNEIHVMKMSCVDCAYYGKWCALGKGKVAPLLFKRGDPARFTARTITRKDLVPDMLVLMLPLGGGIALLIQDFSLSMAMMLGVMLSLSLGGNYVIRSQVACKYCKQRELGCPAEQFFGKK